MGLSRSASRVSNEGHGKENGAGRCSQHLSGYLTENSMPEWVQGLRVALVSCFFGA